MDSLSMIHRHALSQKGARASTTMTQSRALCRVPFAVTRQCAGSKTTAATPRNRPPGRLVIVASSAEDAPVFADFLDEEAMLAKSTFPIKPVDLIAMAKSWLAKAAEGDYDEESMADSFEFVAPVVGPLDKQQFLGAIRSFDLKEGIPDLTGNMHHFRVDPYMHHRVWFTSLTQGTHTGTLAGAIKPTGIAFQSCPQTCSLTFNEDGQIVEYTIGYPMDRRLGTTGGLGGVFGIFYAIGKPLPFPEAKPWKMSKRYSFFQLIGKVNAMLSKK